MAISSTDENSFSGSTVQLVELEQDHPGFNDPAYRQRRNEIAALAKAYTLGEDIPVVDYQDVEQQVWSTVYDHLQPLHHQLACQSYLEGTELFPFDGAFIPDFTSINERLLPMEGFSLAPVAGLVMPSLFLEQLGHRRFLATQYMRHHSKPLYTPEPDVIHEYIGHVPVLAHPELAELNFAFGQAALRQERNEEGRANIEKLIRAYWYTIEFGILEESGKLKVYGAGILSSVDEMKQFQLVEHLPWDLNAIAHMNYDPTQLQKQLFVAPSFETMRDDLLIWLDEM